MTRHATTLTLVSDGPVRVVVDGFALGDASRARGLGTVLRHLLPGLAAHPALDVVVLARPGVATPPGPTVVPLSRHDVRPRLALLEHEWRLPRDLRCAGADVVWSPANHPPRTTPAPLVQTLHDLTPLWWSSTETEHDARRWRRAAARIRGAARIVAVSRSSADQAVRILGVDPARVEVVPNGVDPSYSPGPGARTDVPYLLFVSAWGPHKGFAEAMAVVAALAALGYPHVLKIVGPNDSWMRARVDDVVVRAPRADRVEVLGYVDNLVDLYRGATALVCTSRAEGFGLPIVEAMACGTPVVAFDNTSIAEVAGDAGVLVADGDVDAFVRELRHLIDNDNLRAERSAAGLEQSARFRWDDAVSRYAEIFREVGNR